MGKGDGYRPINQSPPRIVRRKVRGAGRLCLSGSELRGGLRLEGAGMPSEQRHTVIFKLVGVGRVSFLVVNLEVSSRQERH